jgi:hypothetical protein
VGQIGRRPRRLVQIRNHAVDVDPPSEEQIRGVRGGEDGVGPVDTVEFVPQGRRRARDRDRLATDVEAAAVERLRERDEFVPRALVVRPIVAKVRADRLVDRLPVLEVHSSVLRCRRDHA